MLEMEGVRYEGKRGGFTNWTTHVPRKQRWDMYVGEEGTAGGEQ